MYVQCAEHAELHSADVTYCLCFSIIMLNTDLHNQNMKDEARMTLEDYVRFNTTYGEMNRDSPLPASLLTLHKKIFCQARPHRNASPACPPDAAPAAAGKKRIRNNDFSLFLNSSSKALCKNK